MGGDTRKELCGGEAVTVLLKRINDGYTELKNKSSKNEN